MKTTTGPECVARLERSLLTSWPALSVAFDGDWVIRLADGHTKRANSVTCLGGDGPVSDERIDRIEAIYEGRGLPPVFRLSPLAPPALSEALDRRGWRRFDESIVMIRALDPDLSDTSLPQGAKIEIATPSEPDGAWLEACRRFENLSDADLATLSLMLRRLIPDACYGSLSVDRDVAALALAVIDNELIGLFDVNTAREQRRRGFSRRLLTRLLSHGLDRGASLGWLSVAADNEAAIGLYQGLGFAEVYRYHYRSKT